MVAEEDATSTEVVGDNGRAANNKDARPATMCGEASLFPLHEPVFRE